MDHVGITQTLQNIELDPDAERPAGKNVRWVPAPPAKATRMLVTPAEAEHNNTVLGIEQRLRCAVRCVKISNAGAKFGDDD